MTAKARAERHEVKLHPAAQGDTHLGGLRPRQHVRGPNSPEDMSNWLGLKVNGSQQCGECFMPLSSSRPCTDIADSASWHETRPLRYCTPDRAPAPIRARRAVYPDPNRSSSEEIGLRQSGQAHRQGVGTEPQSTTSPRSAWSSSAGVGSPTTKGTAATSLEHAWQLSS